MIRQSLIQCGGLVSSPYSAATTNLGPEVVVPQVLEMLHKDNVHNSSILHYIQPNIDPGPLESGPKTV